MTDRRCIHRGGNLADGKVHGTTSPAHTTVGSSTVRPAPAADIPSLAEGGRIPPKAAIKSYPVIERFEHVWTCLGDPVFELPNPPRSLTWN